MIDNYISLSKKIYSSLINLKIKYPDRYIVMVSGPISTGGLGNISDNIKRMKGIIQTLSTQNMYSCINLDCPYDNQPINNSFPVKKGIVVFDQTPFEEELKTIKKYRSILGLVKDGDYDIDILLQIYKPILESKYLDFLVLVPGWTSSFGACWEVDYAESLGIPCWLFTEILIRGY